MEIARKFPKSMNKTTFQDFKNERSTHPNRKFSPAKANLLDDKSFVFLVPLKKRAHNGTEAAFVRFSTY